MYMKGGQWNPIYFPYNIPIVDFLGTLFIIMFLTYIPCFICYFADRIREKIEPKKIPGLKKSRKRRKRENEAEKQWFPIVCCSITIAFVYILSWMIILTGNALFLLMIVAMVICNVCCFVGIAYSDDD